MLNQLKMWLVQRQRLDQIGPMSHMGPGMKNWLVQYLRLDQIGPMSYMGPGPISDIGPGPMWHMGLAYYWQVRVQDLIPVGSIQSKFEIYEVSPVIIKCVRSLSFHP